MTRAALQAFQRAVETGDLQGLLDIMAPGRPAGQRGRIVQAVRVPIVGAGKVSRLLGKVPPTASLHPAEVNGHPALVVRFEGVLDTVIGVRIDAGLITELYAVRNPEKLSHMERETTLRR